ncbi:MAG: flagellin FliC [Myxococcales bacterium]|nr:flagellin FliC [Myxococcales bacterium]
MAMSIRTNVSSLNAQRNLYQTQGQLDSSLSRLSSGYRITKAGDDAAGLGISVNLEAQIRSFNQGVRNANDGISLIQTAEAAMNEQSNILARLRELAMQSASDGIGATERGYIQSEVDEQVAEVERVAQATEFNGQMLLDGSAVALDFQVGIRNVAANDRITVTTVDATTATLGVDTLDLSTKAGAQAALGVIDTALQTLSTARATLGAAGNRFNSAVASIQASSESLSAANSRIRDVDVAEETSRMARSQVLMQAGVSVLAQANQMPQIALKLLG